MSETRKEHDFLGELDIPADIYYGIQTYRAVENFKISGISISILSKFIQGMACVKKAAALANCELGVLSQEKCEAICKACDEVVHTDKPTFRYIDAILTSWYEKKLSSPKDVEEYQKASAPLHKKKKKTTDSDSGGRQYSKDFYEDLLQESVELLKRK